MGCVPVRFWIACMIFLTTYINYSARVNMSISIVSMTKYGKNKSQPECKPLEPNAAPAEQPNYGERYEWDQLTQGLIISSYFWGYVPSSLPGGVISEWIGPFNAIFWAHVITAASNYFSVMAAHSHFGLLILTRVISGLCGGLVYPACQCLIARWAPPPEKGKFVGALMGNTLGTCLTWPFVGAVTHSYGWEWGFYVISIQMGIFCLIFFIVASDSPDTHRWISEEEKAYIHDSHAGTLSKKKLKTPYASIFLSCPMWILTICHFGNLWGLYLQLTGVPKYLAEVVGFNLKESGGLGALPHLMRLILGMTFGVIADFLKQKEIVGNKFIRKFFIIFSHVIPGLLLIGISFVGCEWIPIVALLTLSMSLNGAAVVTNLLNPQDLSPNFAGTIFGFISFFGGFSGIITPQITGYITRENNGVAEWSWIFRLGGAIYIGCGLIFMIFGAVEQQKWNDAPEIT